MENNYGANIEKRYSEFEYGHLTFRELHEFPGEAFPEDGREIQTEKGRNIDSTILSQ